jgi:hypothetical protein
MAIKTERVSNQADMPGIAQHRTDSGSLQSSSLNEANEDYHHCDDQKNIDEPAHGIRGDKPQKPKDNQNDYDSLEHFAPLAKTWRS